MNPWSQLLGSTVSYHLKTYLFDILKERYGRNEQFIDRLTSNLVTEDDIQGFGKFVADIYETGYLKSVSDHQEALNMRGFKTSVRPEVTEETKEQNRIFPKS